MNNKEKNEKKYYEVWGDSLNSIYFLRTLVIILAGLCVFLVVLLKLSMDKLPLVVRVDTIGQAQAISDWQSGVNITKPEIINFTQTFMELFTQHDLYVYDENFSKAFKMMTPECQRRSDDFLKSNNIIDNIKQSQFKTKLIISKIDIVKDTKNNIILKVKGYREQRSYLNPDFYKEIIYESDVVLSKVKRDIQTPWGLLVDNYSETIIKEK